MHAQDSPFSQDGRSFEREALRRLPSLIAELLDGPEPQLRQDPGSDRGLDALLTDHQQREWAIEFKASGAAGVVARAADQLLAALAGDDLADAIPVLAVPYMTPGGARAAVERGINWIDLSGNAHIRADQLYISREGRPNAFPARGRPASAFAPVSARVARQMLADPRAWWRQKDLAASTALDDGRISRIVRRLDDERLLERRGPELRPADPELLLDAWADTYRFDRHDIVLGHASGNGIELSHELSARLDALHIGHSLTGLPAAWLLDRFASFRLTTIYVEGDPRDVAERLELRQNQRGANVQLVGPDDAGVVMHGRKIDGMPVVSPAQVYLDLLALPERAREAAEHLRGERKLWPT
ncbi:MAG: hypothetical protein ITG02_01860 [Patulibacter sp.]|nr:hypothetical protein [Patulibacter sp.]